MAKPADYYHAVYGEDAVEKLKNILAEGVLKPGGEVPGTDKQYKRRKIGRDPTAVYLSPLLLQGDEAPFHFRIPQERLLDPEFTLGRKTISRKKLEEVLKTTDLQAAFDAAKQLRHKSIPQILARQHIPVSVDDLVESLSEKQAAEFAPGLPDPKRFGALSQLPVGRELLYVIQKHLAERAGPHFDIRFGENLGTKPTLFSWATRHLPTEPGEKRMVFQQPLHTGQYADFEGEITSGYGKGSVKTHEKGRVIVTKVEPNKINFVVTHKKHPEMFTLIRKSGVPGEGTARTKQTQGGSWLMVNTTPTDIIEYKKVHYTKVPQEDIEKLFNPEYLHEEKIDGASALYKLFSDKIEVLSYRPSASGRPIVHTYRVGGTTGLNIPKHLVGSVLRGEIYGVRRDSGKAIPPQELGGILNASTEKSLQKQREQKVELRNRIFNVLQVGKEQLSMNDPRREKLQQIEEIMKYLPQPKFGLPRRAETPEEQRKLWEDVSGGKNPLTREGIVAWPAAGGKPTKVKLYDEHDVYVKDIFPGAKRLSGVGAGGFGYSLTPGGPRVGEVGTGFSEATRREMLEDPDRYIGRVARVKAQEKFPSGALRAPSFLALHEDYPGIKKQADATYDKALRERAGVYDSGPTWWHGTHFKSIPDIIPQISGLRHVLDARDVPIVSFANFAGAARGPLRAYFKRMKEPAGVYISPAHAKALRATGMMFDPAILDKSLPEKVEKHGLIGVAGPDVDMRIIAHELTHASGLRKNPAYSALMNVMLPPGPHWGIAGGAAASALLPRLLKRFKGAPTWKRGVAGALGGLALNLPGIFEELRAERGAEHALKAIGIDPALPFYTQPYRDLNIDVNKLKKSKWARLYKYPLSYAPTALAAGAAAGTAIPLAGKLARVIQRLRGAKR